LAKATSKLNQVAVEAASVATMAPELQHGDGMNEDNDGGHHVQIVSSRKEGFIDLSIGGARPYLTVSQEHYDKMKTLYARHSDEGGCKDQKRAKSAKISSGTDTQDDDQNFHDALYCCLSRYEALRGAGYQCAVPGVGELVG
jgi:hypothetical protein